MKPFAPPEEQPLIFLSGFSPKGRSNAWLRDTRCKARCLSFAYTCPGAFYYIAAEKKTMLKCLKKGVRLMMDSGAFSFQKFMRQAMIKQNKQFGYKKLDVESLRRETIDRYVDFCKQYGKEWDFYVNFDYVVKAPIIWKVQKELERRGLEPVPVFHGDVELEWLDRYTDYPLLCVGSTPERKISYRKSRFYYEQVFEKMAKHGTKLHALAVTSLSLLFQFPWYSVDSATWTKAASYGCILHIDEAGNVITQVHVSVEYSTYHSSYNRLPEDIRRAVRRQVEGFGFDFEQVRNSMDFRARYNAYLFSNHLHDLKEAVSRTRKQWETLV